MQKKLIFFSLFFIKIAASEQSPVETALINKLRKCYERCQQHWNYTYHATGNKNALIAQGLRYERAKIDTQARLNALRTKELEEENAVLRAQLKAAKKNKK